MLGRPRIQITPSAADRSLERIGICLLVLLWVLSVICYLRSPEIVPIHFNERGDADGFGTRIHILVLPLIPTALYFLLGWLNKYPHIFNYPVTITEENAVKHYSNATKLIRVLKIALLLTFIITIITGYLAGTGNKNGLGAFTIPLICLLMLGPIAFFVYRAFREK